MLVATYDLLFEKGNLFHLLGNLFLETVAAPIEPSADAPLNQIFDNLGSCFPIKGMKSEVFIKYLLFLSLSYDKYNLGPTFFHNTS